MDGKIEIKDVLDKYDELGFDANQDTPGNFLWEEVLPKNFTLLALKEMGFF